jgi:hypothetical protein
MRRAVLVHPIVMVGDGEALDADFAGVINQIGQLDQAIG